VSYDTPLEVHRRLAEKTVSLAMKYGTYVTIIVRSDVAAVNRIRARSPCGKPWIKSGKTHALKSLCRRNYLEEFP